MPLESLLISAPLLLMLFFVMFSFKKCPHCTEKNSKKDKVCKGCGRGLK
jgi:hypothetical protein